MSVRIINADVLDGLAQLPDKSVHCVVTSPPYWGLRDYGVDGQIGLEPTPAEFVSRLVGVFREVRRVLRKDGTCWVNLGDSYASGGERSTGRNDTDRDTPGGKGGSFRGGARATTGQRDGLKPKDLVGIPWRFALAMQDDGWWLRQDIIWCLSGGAWIYARTRKGDMPVMVKDLVRLDPRTVKLWNGTKWTQVLGWGPSNDTTEKIELVLRSGERIGCTGGHLWPTKRGNVAARDLRIGDIVQSCQLPEPDGCERPAYITDDMLWLIGLFMAEGSWSNNAGNLSLSADEQEWLPRLERVARHYGGSMGHTVTGNMLTVRIFGGVMAAILRTYVGGSVAIDKHLKVSAWRLPNDALRLIAEGYLAGDGHNDHSNGRWRLGFCRNYALERDLRTLAARLGATLTLKPAIASYQNGEAPAFRGEWRWERTGHWNEKDRGEIVEMRASRARHFWDIAVEDEPHLFALASGVLTHNCKPNPMPESVTDRCTKAHEYIFLLTKGERYAYDAEAIKEPAMQPVGVASLTGQHKANAGGFTTNGTGNSTLGSNQGDTHRNKRSVWTIATAPFSEAHFATFPPELPELCIKAGCPVGGTVLDPFSGAGTTALVADRLQRNAIGIELNPEYAAMSERRINGDRGGLLDLMEDA